VYKHPPYQPFKDLVPIGAIQLAPIVLTVALKTPVKNYAEFAARARAHPGQMTIASAGNGSSNHLAIELLMHQANLQLLHVPYKGSGPALTDLIGGQVDSMMDQLTASIGHIKEGRIRALAISSLKRSPLLPDLPTLDEAGVKGYEAGTFTGLFVPAGTPPALVERLAAALEKARADEGVRGRYRALGVEMMDMSRAEFAAFVRADYQKWVKVAREANISLD
jgi:tripartite-type tricarboxylate transporter receptor subunit TctC